MQKATRRRFLGTSLISAALAPAVWPLAAMERVVRPGAARLRLSLAAYSFRQYFKTASPPPQGVAAERSIDLFEFINYCAEQGCEGTELTSYYFPSDLDDAYLLRIRRHAFLRGISISGTAVGNTFTWPRGETRDQEIAQVKRWIDRAALMGAPHIRIFAGNRQAGMSLEEAKEICIETITECCDYAGQKGIFLGLENHGGIVAEPDDLLDIVRAVESHWFGINLDTGNFHTADPYGDLERCAPYAVNVQVKVEIQARGKPRGPADLARLIQILRESRYQGFVVLEYEAAEDPWVAVPKVLGELKGLMAG
jgi:sugar phosphate isomerase/epimerase